MKALTTPPSTTVTWAVLAGGASTVAWELVDTFTQYEPTAGLIAGSTTLVSGVVGKLVKEKRYKMTVRD
jgi:hypothetical protein